MVTSSGWNVTRLRCVRKRVMQTLLGMCHMCVHTAVYSLHRGGTALAEPGPPWIILARVCFHNWRVNIESIQAPSVLLSSDRWAFANRLARTGTSNRCVLVFLSLLTALELAVAVIMPAFRMKEMLVAALPLCTRPKLDTR